MKTSEQTGTPEARAAGHGADVTVLFEILELGIVTQRNAAIVAEGEIVFQDPLSEGLKRGVVPDGEDGPIRQAAKGFRPYVFNQATDITTVAVP